MRLYNCFDTSGQQPHSGSASASDHSKCLHTDSRCQNLLARCWCIVQPGMLHLLSELRAVCTKTPSDQVAGCHPVTVNLPGSCTAWPRTRSSSGLQHTPRTCRRRHGFTLPAATLVSSLQVRKLIGENCQQGSRNGAVISSAADPPSELPWCPAGEQAHPGAVCTGCAEGALAATLPLLLSNQVGGLAGHANFGRAEPAITASHSAAALMFCRWASSSGSSLRQGRGSWASSWTVEWWSACVPTRARLQTSPRQSRSSLGATDSSTTSAGRCSRRGRRTPAPHTQSG